MRTFVMTAATDIEVLAADVYFEVEAAAQAAVKADIGFDRDDHPIELRQEFQPAVNRVDLTVRTTRGRKTLSPATLVDGWTAIDTGEQAQREASHKWLTGQLRRMRRRAFGTGGANHE